MYNFIQSFEKMNHDILETIFLSIPERSLLQVLTLNKEVNKIISKIGDSNNKYAIANLVEAHHFIQLSKQKKDEIFWRLFVVGACEIGSKELIELATVHGYVLDIQTIGVAISLGKTRAIEYIVDNFEFDQKYHSNTVHLMYEFSVFNAVSSVREKLLTKYNYLR